MCLESLQQKQTRCYIFNENPYAQEDLPLNKMSSFCCINMRDELRQIMERKYCKQFYFFTQPVPPEFHLILMSLDLIKIKIIIIFLKFKV